MSAFGLFQPAVFRSNGNARAAVGMSRLSGDAWAALDALPYAIRAAIAQANVDLCPLTIRRLYLEVERQCRLLGLEHEAITLYLECFDEAQQGEIEKFSRLQEALHGPTPHVAAEATRLTEKTRRRRRPAYR